MKSAIKIEPYFYVKKYKKIHYIIHLIMDEVNYIEKISSSIYSTLILYDVIKDTEETVVIYEIDPFKELNNVTCIKHADNKLHFIYDKIELEAIFPDLVKNNFKDKLSMIIFNYENQGYYYDKTGSLNSLFNLLVGVDKFPIKNVNYFMCKKSLKK